DTGQVLRYGNNVVSTQHERSDYVNLGACLPANPIPAQVTAAYPASVNGGSAYTHEYRYPHPLVTGGPSPTPIPSSSPTATATATHTFSSSWPAINRHMPEHVVHAVADALNTQHKAIKGSRDEPFVSELPRTWPVGAVQSRIRGTRWRTCPYREERA